MQSFDIKDLMSRLQGLDQRKADDEIYAQIFDEYTSGIMDKVAQARAMESAGGDQEKIKSEYIRFRFIRIRDEIAAVQRTERQKQAQIDADRKAAQRRQREAQEALREEVKNRNNSFSNNVFDREYDRQLDKLHREQNEKGTNVVLAIFGIAFVTLAILLIFSRVVDSW